MKRALLYLLGVLMFTSCEKENLNIIDRNNFSITEQTFKVQKKDIEQAINNYLSSTNKLRSRNKNFEIVSIDSVITSSNLRSISPETPIPDNLLYFVKLSDNTTFIVAGDKRAEPIQAHISNVNLKFKDGKLIDQDGIPDQFRYMIGVSTLSILDRIGRESVENIHWHTPKVASPDENYEYKEPSKCKVLWGQGYPFNNKSPESSGRYSDRGKAASGCVTIAIAQALTVLKDDFTVFKGYELKTSWNRLKEKQYGWNFYKENEIQDISNIVKRIAENIKISYDSDGSAGAKTKDGISFLSNYLGGMYGYDKDWCNIEKNMKENSRGISILCGNEQSNGWFWKAIGIKMPELSGHCMLLDGFIKRNGQTLFYINFGWGGYANGYYLYDDKTWSDEAKSKYKLLMEVYNFHIDTDYDDF